MIVFDFFFFGAALTESIFCLALWVSFFGFIKINLAAYSLNGEIPFIIKTIACVLKKEGAC